MLTDDIVTIPCVYELQIWSEMMNHHFQTMRKAKYMQILVFISFLVKRLLSRMDSNCHVDALSGMIPHLLKWVPQLPNWEFS